MAEESAKLRIPYIAASQAQKHVTHNEAMTLLDTLVQLSVLDKDLAAPPGSPEEGDTYIVAASATGAWLGWDGRVARFIDGAWRSYLPGAGDGAGWLAFVIDEELLYRFDGTNWEPAFDTFAPDAVVDAIAGRDDYDDEAANFSVLVTADSGNGNKPTLYFKLSATSADWSSGVDWMPPGADGAAGPAGPAGQSFQPDAVVALIAGRDAYDDEAAAFSVLVISDSTNGNQPTLYFKLSATSADWSDGITWVPASGAFTDLTDAPSSYSGHGGKAVAVTDEEDGLEFVDFPVGGGPPQGRLTLTTGVPVLTASVTGATTIYYAPYNGNAVPIYNGAKFVARPFSELSLALDSNSGHTGYHQSGKNFDLFVIDDNGTIRLASGPAWSDDATRAEGLSRIDGILVSDASIVLRYGSGVNDHLTYTGRATYLGTFRATANGQTEMNFGGTPAAGGSGVSLGLWNMYNRRAFAASSYDNTNTWSTSSSTFRGLNNNAAGNFLRAVSGLAEDAFEIVHSQWGSANTVAATVFAIGVGSNTTPSSPRVATLFTGALLSMFSTFSTRARWQGWSFFVPLEAVNNNGNSCDIFGDAGQAAPLSGSVATFLM